MPAATQKLDGKHGSRSMDLPLKAKPEEETGGGKVGTRAKPVNDTGGGKTGSRSENPPLSAKPEEDTGGGKGGKRAYRAS